MDKITTELNAIDARLTAIESWQEKYANIQVSLDMKLAAIIIHLSKKEQEKEVDHDSWDCRRIYGTNNKITISKEPECEQSPIMKECVDIVELNKRVEQLERQLAT